MVLPKGYEEREFTYKRKLKDGAVSYDVYYEKGGDQFAINYDPLGKILKEERRIKLSDIPYDTQVKIEKVLADHYPGYRILMVKQLYAMRRRCCWKFFFPIPNLKRDSWKQFLNSRQEL